LIRHRFSVLFIPIIQLAFDSADFRFCLLPIELLREDIIILSGVLGSGYECDIERLSQHNFTVIVTTVITLHTSLCDDNNSSAPKSSLYLTGSDIQLRGVHNIATWVLHLMHGFQTCNIKFPEILICTEPTKTSILFLHAMQINNHYYYYGNNTSLVINNTKKFLACISQQAVCFILWLSYG